MTTLGEPIGLGEYAAWTAETKKTHVILFFDFDADKHWRIEGYHVKEGTTFHELVLPNRPGYNRLTLVP